MGSQTSKSEGEQSSMAVHGDDDAVKATSAQQMTAAADEDEPDEWDKRIFSTGCAEENARMTDCYFEKKDWRACTAEMEQFKQCWKQHGNDERTGTKDA